MIHQYLSIIVSICIAHLHALTQYDIGCHYAMFQKNKNTIETIPLEACLTSFKSLLINDTTFQTITISKQYACNLNGQLTHQSFAGKTCTRTNLESVNIIDNNDLLYNSCNNSNYKPCPHFVAQMQNCNQE
eukprot:413915_1